MTRQEPDGSRRIEPGAGAPAFRSGSPLTPDLIELRDLELPTALSAGSFRKLAAYITNEVGIKMSGTKVSMVQSRLLRRVRALELRSLDAYVEYLLETPEGKQERTHCIDAITTNKTDFFREPEHFSYLARVVNARPDARRGPAQRFGVWCAGCSTGEEAYTLAMLLEEHAAQISGFAYSILATDISTRVLKHTATAIYAEDRIEPIPVPLREKYLLRSKDASRRTFRIVPVLRGKISLKQLNFMDDSYAIREMFEAIFFRNVMIYFDKPTQEAVVTKLAHNLVAGGHLFVGHSESLADLRVPLRQVAPAVYCRL